MVKCVIKATVFASAAWVYNVNPTAVFRFKDVDAEGALAIGQKLFDTELGAANYDLGHVLALGANTGLGVFEGLCNNENKGQGISPSGSYGDNHTLFATDMLAHEIGHQLNAEHTFNSLCSAKGADSGRTETSSFEVGSGVTIMGYAGICSGPDGTTVQNVDSRGNGFFHSFMRAGSEPCFL